LPVRPEGPARPGWRDVLVVTFRRRIDRAGEAQRQRGGAFILQDDAERAVATSGDPRICRVSKWLNEARSRVATFRIMSASPVSFWHSSTSSSSSTRARNASAAAIPWLFMVSRI
jgi:hypothetical protein